MPERLLAPYVVMLPRLEAEETQRAIEAQLYAAGHGMGDADRRAYGRRLNERAAGLEGRQRAPAISPAFARRLGMRIDGEFPPAASEREEVKRA